MTSPGEPRTGGREAAGRPGAGVRSPGRGRAGRAARAEGGGGAAGPGAWGRPRSPTRDRLRLGLRAARSASLALQVPVTHTDTRSRPSRSLAPPPSSRRAGQTHRRAPTEVAGNEHVGHRGGRARRGRGRTEPGRAPQTPRAAAARPGSAPGAAAAAWAARWAARGREAVWGPGTSNLHALCPCSSLLPQPSHPHSQADAAGTQRVRGCARPPPLAPGPRGSGAPTPHAAPSPWRRRSPRRAESAQELEPGDQWGTRLKSPRRGGRFLAGSHGLCGEEASPECLREVLGPWMGKSLLPLAPNPCALCICSWRTTGHFRPESSLS